MKISVVTSVLNREDTIAQTIASLAVQSHPDIEHIIQDAGSTDGTLRVVQRMSGGFAKIESCTDTGIYDGINRGIARATGDVVGLLHSDDFYASPTILASVAKALEDPSVDGVYGDLDYVASDNTNRIVRKWRSGPFSHDRIRQGWMPPHPTLYLRRSVYEEWGVYDTSFRIAADYDAMLRFMCRGEVNLAYIPEVFVKMRTGGASNKSLSNILRKSREDYRAIRANGVGGMRTLAMKNLSKIQQLF